MRIVRWGLLLAALAMALALVAVSPAAKKPPTHSVKIPSPNAGDVTLAHFVLTARTTKANKTAPKYKLANAASLGSSYYVADSVKRGKSKGHTTYDVTVAVLKGNASKVVNRAKTSAGVPPLVVNITGDFTVANSQSLANLVGANKPLPFSCNPGAPAATWGEAGLPGLHGPAAFAFACNAGNDQPGDLGVATILGANYAAITDTYFPDSKTEHVTTAKADFVVKGFQARTSSDTKINNKLPPAGFTCTVQVAVYECFDPQGVPIGTLITWNLDFSGELPAGTDIVIEFSTDGSTFSPDLTFQTPAAD